MGAQPKNTSRLFILLGAVLTIMAMGGVYFIASKASKSAAGGSATVLVAAREVPSHTVFTTSADATTWFKSVQVPASAKPLGAFSSVADFQKRLLASGKQATAETVYQNEPLLPSMFYNLGSARTGVTEAFALKKGDVAVSLQASSVNESAGAIASGDSIDLIASFTGVGTSGGSDHYRAPTQTQYVLQNLKVLAVGPITPGSPNGSTSAPAGSSGGNGSLLTVETSHQTALIIQHLKDFPGSWEISAVLRSAYDKGLFHTRPVTVGWFFGRKENSFTTH